MDDLEFEWDDYKNQMNIKKHGISFDEAENVFYDDYARVKYDPKHSRSENRFIIIGKSNESNLLIVCYCYKDCNDIIRIFSARKATKNESNQYFDLKGDF